jgi:hypothetical protein
MKARGNAPGAGSFEVASPERAQQKPVSPAMPILFRPFRAGESFASLTQGVALGYPVQRFQRDTSTLTSLKKNSC